MARKKKNAERPRVYEKTDDSYDIEIESEDATDVDNYRSLGFKDGDGVEIETGEGDFILFENADEAGKAAREYWEDMALNDPSEFTAMVSEETLVSWGLGQAAGPGTTKVRNLEEWLDLWRNTPEEQWASYDGNERQVMQLADTVVDELGFKPTVAYRTN